MIGYECSYCGVSFGMSESYSRSLKQTGGKFYCLNGHVMSFGESTAETLRRELDRAKQQIARAEDEAREARQESAAQLALRKRIEKRIHNGVCPCCSRSFANLKRHMATKHPNVTPIKAAS